MVMYVCQVCGTFCTRSTGLYRCQRGHVRKTARKAEDHANNRTVHQLDVQGSPDVGGVRRDRRTVRLLSC